MAKEENNLNIIGDWENFNPTGALTAKNPFKHPLPYYPKGSTQEEIIMDVIQANMLYFLSQSAYCCSLRMFLIERVLNGLCCLQNGG